LNISYPSKLYSKVVTRSKLSANDKVLKKRNCVVQTDSLISSNQQVANYSILVVGSLHPERQNMQCLDS
jgi:hypothetical protein